jgi:glycosyltransferase involved in cell wall biosynthesis
MITAQNSFKFVGGARMPLGKAQELFRNPILDQTVIANKDLLSAASLCKDLAPLHEHAGRIERRLGIHANGGRDWNCVLEDAVRIGLLVSEQQMASYIVAKFAESTERRVIDTIAIPTRNRPNMLARLLSSLSEHLRRFGRQVDVCVLDDSQSVEIQNANLQVVNTCSADCDLNVRYGNRASRNRFAVQLASESGVPREVAEFAVLGRPPFPVSTGAARNSILLETVGRSVLFMDDDVLCNFARIPGARDCVIFQGDAFSTWFFHSYEQLRDCDFTPLDLIAAHEQLMNLDRNALAATNPPLCLDTSRVSSRFLKTIRRGDVRVLVSLTGIVGDSGWDDPLGYFFLGHDTVTELTKNEETYRSAMRNRLILNGPAGICVSDQCTCHSTCMAVDNTSLLPPFTPVMRGQDLMFGSMLVKCLPGALFGAIPAAILHKPGEERSFSSNAAAARAGTFMTGETLALLARLEPIRGSSSAALMRSLGSHLQEMKALSGEDFRAYVRSAVEPMLILSIQQLEAAIDRHSSQPAFWIKDALNIRESAINALNTHNYGSPTDLEFTFGETSGEGLFREFIQEFGTLLIAWPDLVRASERLHQQGVHICNPTTESRWPPDTCSAPTHA